MNDQNIAAVYPVRQARDARSSSPPPTRLVLSHFPSLRLFGRWKHRDHWLGHLGNLFKWPLLPFWQRAGPAIGVFSPKLNVRNDLNSKMSDRHAPCYSGKAEEE